MVDQNGLSCQCAELPTCLARQLERELAAVTADLCAFAVDMEKQLSASQQEAQRLREAIESQLSVNKEVNKLEAGNFYLPETIDGFFALSSTPAPVHKDTERLNFCDTMIDLAPGFYVLRFPVTESCTIRDAIDAELARND